MGSCAAPSAKGDDKFITTDYLQQCQKPNQDDEPFFITEEIAAEMIAGGYEFELPPIPCTIRLRDVLERMTDAELALQPGEIADQERERCRRKPCSTS
ncbi:hypothetical protein [Klebsiella pneumoniae]|uniref:hypothetical protein n=1 Tax=Klebsiella pneumoniae TaxID=573 RepID=UPI003CFA285B